MIGENDSVLFIKVLSIKISLLIFLFVGPTYATAQPPFSMIMYYVGQMIFDPGISINQITDHSEYIKLKGQARNKLQAYLLAEKLLHSNMQKDFKFEDVVPFWNNKSNTFTFILKKSVVLKNNTSITIESPLPRAQLKGVVKLYGVCHTESKNVIISGDFTGKTECTNGRWLINFTERSKRNLPILGIKIYQKTIKQKFKKDFRSIKT